MIKLENYITGLLGFEFEEEAITQDQQKELPFYIKEIYKIKRGFLLRREVLLLEQKFSENHSPEQYRKQTKLIEDIFHKPVVLVLENLESYNRKRLIEKRVSFIVPGKQMFIPQFLIDLREFKNTSLELKETLQPAAQCILFYHLLKGNISEMNFKKIAEKINYRQMTITRAAKDLVEKELCRIEGTNQRKILFNENDKKLWEKALPYLLNPVKRKIYINGQIDESLIFKAGSTALSEVTDISEEPISCFAISKTDYMYLRKHDKINITNKFEGKMCLEIWKYSPALFARDKRVDPLSLFLSFRESNDERVEIEIEKMVNRLW